MKAGIIAVLAILPLLGRAAPLVATPERSITMEGLDDHTRLRPGDRIWYHIVQDGEASLHLRVRRGGTVQLPIWGEQKVEGLTPKILAKQIQTKLEKNYYAKATVLIEVDEFGRSLMGPPAPESPTFRIIGEVARSGIYFMDPSGRTTTSQAILRAGGLPWGTPQYCVITRHTTQAKSATRLT